MQIDENFNDAYCQVLNTTFLNHSIRIRYFQLDTKVKAQNFFRVLQSFRKYWCSTFPSCTSKFQHTSSKTLDFDYFEASERVLRKYYKCSYQKFKFVDLLLTHLIPFLNPIFFQSFWNVLPSTSINESHKYTFI